MRGSEKKSVRRNGGMPLAMFAVAIALGASGCFLPIITAIPSVIGLASAMYKSNTGTDTDADPRAPTAEASAADSSKPPDKLTPGNQCQAMAIAHPDMVLVELRKNGTGAPEYRELHLLNSANEAHWTPVVGSETGPDGWLPAVNFLKMDFNPPLTAEIPDAGTCYLAYAPIAIDPNNPVQSAELKSPDGTDMGTFSWAGRVYQYTVAPTLPCLSPSS
jgi:hypothetical protein